MTSIAPIWKKSGQGIRSTAELDVHVCSLHLLLVFSSQDISRRCTHSRDLNDLAQPWTFTRLPSKLTLDYIFTPDPGAVGSHVPGQAGCKVIHPELETNGGILLIPDDPQKRVLYSFIGSWDEISDHYPVFMQFEPLVEPLGATDEARRKRAGAEQIWP